MVAACLAEGRTTIRSAAREPEVGDVGRVLNSCGAEIKGLGSAEITIGGVKSLHGCDHTIVPDRIEAATFAIAAAATRGNVLLTNSREQDFESVIAALRDMNVEVSITPDGIRISTPRKLTPTNITALPFPGIPTDTQAQFMALLATIDGESGVTDSVFPDRFMHASELLRMGGRIRREGSMAMVKGGVPLSGANVMASDLRASAALVIAALAAKGESHIRRIYHLDRGYASLETKLNRLGANIRRERDEVRSTKIQAPHFQTQEVRQRSDGLMRDRE